MSNQKTVRITTTADEQSTEFLIFAPSLDAAVCRCVQMLSVGALEAQPRRRLTVTFEVVEEVKL